jgi:hypothetical protein
MSELLINKVFLIIFCMCLLNIGRHIFEVIKRLRQDIPERYVISNRSRLLLGLSISYIFTEIVFMINL